MNYSCNESIWQHDYLCPSEFLTDLQVFNQSNVNSQYSSCSIVFLFSVVYFTFSTAFCANWSIHTPLTWIECLLFLIPQVKKQIDDKEPVQIIESKFCFTSEYLMKFYKTCIQYTVFNALSNEVLVVFLLLLIFSVKWKLLIIFVQTVLFFNWSTKTNEQLTEWNNYQKYV